MMKLRKASNLLIGALGIFLMVPFDTFAAKTKKRDQVSKKGKEQLIQPVDQKPKPPKEEKPVSTQAASEKKETKSEKKAPAPSPVKGKKKSKKQKTKGEKGSKSKDKAKEKETTSEVLEGKKETSITNEQLEVYKEVIGSIEQIKSQFLEPYLQAFFENRQNMTVIRFIELKATGGELKKLNAIKATKEELEVFGVVDSIHKKLGIQFEKIYKQLIEAKLGIMVYNLIAKKLEEDETLKARYEKIGKKDEAKKKKKKSKRKKKK